MAARWLLITLRILSIFMLVILLIEVGLIYNSTIFNFQTILVVLGNLRDLVSYGSSSVYITHFMVSIIL